MALIFSARKVGVTYAGGSYAGLSRIVGTTKVTGTPDAPVRRRVRLHLQATGAVVRDAWSDPTSGAYEFGWIKVETYYVVAFDHTLQFNGVIESDVTPEPMP